MIKNIIFDWSGVVKDSVLTHLFCVNKIFDKFGVKNITVDELKENWQHPYMVFYGKYLPGSVTKEQVDNYYKQIVPKAPTAKEFPGVINLIKKIKKNGKKIFILSSDYKETIFLEIKEFGLDGIFEGVSAGIYEKKDAAKKLIDEKSLDKGETIIIGDTAHEIEAGKQAGIKTIAVTWGYGTEKQLKVGKPDFIVHNIKELENILL